MGEERLPFEPLSPVVRRLTRVELLNTVADVFDIQLGPGDLPSLPTERPLEGFVNISTGQTVLPDHVRGFAQLAEALATRVDVPALRRRLGGCDDADADCARRFLEDLGPLLFRRPASALDLDPWVELFETAFAEGLSFDESVPWVLRGMVQAPDFLYLLEPEREGDGPARSLDGASMAARLSYALWATAPDDELRAAAADGRLETQDGVRAQVTRMLADESRLLPVLDRYVVDWARIASIPDGDGLQDELTEAASLYYRRLATEDLGLFDLLTEPTAVLTPALAEGYGVEVSGDGPRTYQVPEGGGLLGQPGVLAGMTNADGGAVVARGLFLEKQLFCDEVPEPPDSLQGLIDEFADAQPANASDREIAEIRMARDECGSCHSAFDPLAFGFERFDFRGRLRTVDEHGNSLRTDGWIPGRFVPGGELQPYADLPDYLSQLAELEQVKRCLVQRQIEFFTSRRLEEAQAEAVDRVLEAAPEGRFPALVAAILTDPVFTTRKVVE
ncbi:MAG: DUF1592 domain-containing protein [Myxococcota bacterium]